MDDERIIFAFKIKKINLKMDYLEYKGYKGSVEYSKTDNCLYGKVQGMSKDTILYEGNTLEEIENEFREAVDDYIYGCEAEGIKPRKPYSGRIVLRMSSELHERLAMFAANMGSTINDVINRAINNEIARAQ